MVILDMVIFSDIRKYGNMPYGNVFRNYYHISTSKYGKIKNLCFGGIKHFQGLKMEKKKRL